MVEFAGNAIVEDFLCFDEFLSDIVELLLIPHLIIKEILIINNLNHFRYNLQPLNITQIHLHLPKKHLPNPTYLHIIRLLKPIARLQSLIQYHDLIMQPIEFLNLTIIGLEDSLVL